MKHSLRGSIVGALTLLAGLFMSTPTWANGQEFFDPGANAKVDLAYVGRVRDVAGRFLKGATIVVWSEAAGLTFPSVSDMYGHYRTPDVGATMKEVAIPIDPNELQVTCALPGYELVRKPKIPKKTSGRVVMDFVLRPVGVDGKTAPTEERKSAGLLWAVPGLLALVVIGAAVRK